MKYKIILCILWLYNIHIFAQETALQVVPLQGTKHNIILSSIGKIVYQCDSLYIYDKRCYVLYTESLHQIGHINYSEVEKTPTNSQITQEFSNVLVYPNPTQEVLIVRNAQGKAAQIYDLRGSVVLTASMNDGGANIDVSSLPSGTYILLIQNGVFQFIKQ